MRILAVNPWIEDFAAYDYWLKPYGFLKILTYLKQHGAEVTLIDCLDRLRFGGQESTPYGSGKFLSEQIPTPDVLKNVPRHWKRYGMKTEVFLDLASQIKKPDYILLTSSMTYWYTGVQYTVDLLRTLFPQTPLILGGTYATLCPDHARKNISCDHVFTATELEQFFALLNVPYQRDHFRNMLPDYPAFYPKMEYLVLKTGEGCMFDCTFCAVHRIAPEFYKVPGNSICDYLYSHYKKGIRNFVFSDDSLFFPQEYIKELLHKLLSLGITDAFFHTPNGLHLRAIDKELAVLMKKLNFIRPYVSIETLDRELRQEISPKLETGDIERVASYLWEAGYKKGEVFCYMLFCLPGQDLQQVMRDCQILHAMGFSVNLTEFSPIPGTEIMKNTAAHIEDPLLTNNSIYLFFQENFKEVFVMKSKIREMNRRF